MFVYNAEYVSFNKLHSTLVTLPWFFECKFMSLITFNWHLKVNFIGQSLHSNGVTPVWISWCRFKLLLSEYAFTHLSNETIKVNQWKDFVNVVLNYFASKCFTKFLEIKMFYRRGYWYALVCHLLKKVFAEQE